jgi:predicted RNA-binding Zn-ribbon protein involved in translation (DUF1610 family)
MPFYTQFRVPPMPDEPDAPESAETYRLAEAEPEDNLLQGQRDRAGRTTDQGQARVFPCESCGADLEFHIGQQQLKCPYCGFQKEIELREDADVTEQDYHAAIERLEQLHEQGRHDESGNQELHCESCGGTVMFEGTLTSTSCPWCNAPIQRENIHTATHRIPVDAVIPFLIEKDRAQLVLKEWINSRWFAPTEFRKRGIDGKFDGFYLPFWTYDSLTFNAYSGERGEDYTVTVGTGKNRRTETRTRWYPASGRFQRFFDDVLICAAEGMPTSLLDALEPWPMERLTPFAQQLLAGLFARTYDVTLDAGFDVARERMKVAIESETRRRIGGDRQRIHSLKTRHDAITFKHLLLPVWMLAYRFHDKTYRVFINATTGEVQGERPYSWVKITLLVLAIAAAIAAVFAVKAASDQRSGGTEFHYGTIFEVELNLFRPLQANASTLPFACEPGGVSPRTELCATR